MSDNTYNNEEIVPFNPRKKAKKTTNSFEALIESQIQKQRTDESEVVIVIADSSNESNAQSAADATPGPEVAAVTAPETSSSSSSAPVVDPIIVSEPPKLTNVRSKKTRKVIASDENVIIPASTTAEVSSSSSSSRSNGKPAKPVKPVKVVHEWNIHYAAFQEWYKENVTCNVPVDASYECTLVGMGENGGDYHYEHTLGKWLSDQRKCKRRNKGKWVLTPEREALLQVLVDEEKLSWITPSVPRVPKVTKTTTTNEDGTPATAAGESSNESRQRRERRPREPDEVSWPRNYAALLEYYNQYGTCNVQSQKAFECTLVGMGDDGGDYLYQNVLGRWLRNQRLAKIDRKLLPEREGQLQTLVDDGKLLWEIPAGPPAVNSWSRHFAAMLDYCAIYGTCNVPSKYAHDCILPGMGDKKGEDYHYVGNLGQWLSDQRKSKKYTGDKGKWNLTAERRAKLQELVEEGKLLWDAPRLSANMQAHIDVIWQRHFAALMEYYNQNGTCNVTNKNVYECTLPGMGDNGEDYNYKMSLGCWVRNQRRAKKGFGDRGEFTPEREQQLQQLVDEGKFVWEFKKDTSII